MTDDIAGTGIISEDRMAGIQISQQGKVLPRDNLYNCGIPT
jgi:hypothetical protein